MKRINAIDALSILLLLLIVNQDQAFGFQMARSVSATTAYSSISANALDRISSTTRSSSTTTDESSFELSKLSNNAVCSNRRNFAIHMASRDHRYEYQYIGRDADYGEILAGGQRYEMVELPDSMVDTTIFVGNLCEVSHISHDERFFVEINRKELIECHDKIFGAKYHFCLPKTMNVLFIILFI